MIEIPIYNQTGQEVEKFQVDEAKLGGEVRQALLKQALVMYHANLRQGTAKTKRRGEVEGSTRKIFRQKGTGNARMGPVRNPVRKGGGHAKQKLPKDWRLAMPKKQRQLARDSALLAKLRSNQVKVVDGITLGEEKTKAVAGIFKALGIERTCVVAMPQHDEMLARCSRNINRATLTTVSQLNAWDIMKNQTLLLTKAGLEQMLA